MIKVLFVCTGNICRSPMAEAVMLDLLEREGLTDQIKVDSAGLISYHTGQDADPRAIEELSSHEIKYSGISRQVTKDDYNEFDYILGMTRGHVEELRYNLPPAAKAKVRLFLGYCDVVEVEDVIDPYYDGGFENVYELVKVGCESLLKYLREEELKGD